jgi:RNA polymerase sigma-70 factor (ECF subfamily)
MPAKSPEIEAPLVARLRAGDEIAFAELVDQLHARLIAMARTFTSAPALAEDIVQETWLAVIRGLHGFEGRSSLRTWIFSILVRRARTLTSKEARRGEVPAEADTEEVEWEPGRGRIGLWTARPVPWGLEDPAAAFQTREALVVVQEALERLPATQRQAVLLRDVEDLSAVDVCNVLQISETNQRVLLHRGRAHIRAALDRYLRGGIVFHPSATAAGNTTRGETGAAVTLHANLRGHEDGHGMR